MTKVKPWLVKLHEIVHIYISIFSNDMIQHKILMITEGIQRHGQDRWLEFDLGKRHSFQLLGLLHHFKTSACMKAKLKTCFRYAYHWPAPRIMIMMMIMIIVIMMLTSPEETRLCCRQYGNKEKECLMMTLWRFGGSHFETLTAKVCVRICRTSSGTLQSMDQLSYFSQVLKSREKEDKTISAILGPDRSLTDLATPATNSWDGFAPSVVPGWHPRAVEYGSSEKIYKTMARNVSCTHTYSSFVQVLSYMKVYFLPILIHQHALLV